VMGRYFLLRRIRCGAARGAIVVVGSILITKAIRSAKFSGDAAVAIFMTLGLATGVFVTSVTLQYGFDLDALLFGSILLVTCVLLISALLVLPALASIQVTQSFKQTILLSPVLGSISVILGLLFSIIEPNAAPGGTIVLSGLAILLVAILAKKIKGSA